jgi:demethylmenaquinone methyltransferase/2-methoxy-6-polyprenyl-1,4-benzoquinol methylase
MESTTSQPAWTDPLLANPHAVADKAQRVNRMFSAIAPSYDLNNRLHSMGMDQHWRSVAVKMAGVELKDQIVDVACGTGDLTLAFATELQRKVSEFAKTHYGNLEIWTGLHTRHEIFGIDFTYEMLPIARAKAAAKRFDPPRHVPASYRSPFLPPVRMPRRMETSPVFTTFINGDAMALPLADNSADILSIAFGIRNVADWGKAIDEFARVLKPGGRLIILEFSLPTNPIMRGLYNFYFRKIIPRTATLISGDKSGAYKYLPESVNTFISRELMQDRMKTAGFEGIVARPMTFGVCVCYKGVRKP